MKTKLLPLVALACTMAAAALAHTTGPSAATQGLPGQPPPRKWGKMIEDLRVSALTEGAWGKAGAPARVTIENVGARPADMQGAFAWVLIAYEGGTVYYTDKIDLVPILKDQTLAGSSLAEGVLDLAKVKTFTMTPGQEVLAGYPKTDDPKPKATLGELLTTTPGKGQLIVYVPSRKAMVKSGPIPIVAGSELVRAFARDEFAAMGAHHEAVKRGKDAVPELLDALDATRGIKLPWFGQMWVVAALCDIGDPRAVPVLTKTLAKGGPAANVVAYHGPKLKSKELDDAIVKAAESDTGVAAWAARGFAVHGGKLRWDLVDSGLKAKDPKVRAGLAEGLVKDSSPKAIDALRKLLADEDPTVRTEAVQWVGKSGTRSKPVWKALVKALATPGDPGRAAICEVLETLTGRKGPWPAKGNAADKDATLRAWRAWAQTLAD